MTKQEYLSAVHDWLTQANELDKAYNGQVLESLKTGKTEQGACSEAWLATADVRLDLQKRREDLTIERLCLERCLFNGIDMAAKELVKTMGLQERLLSTIYGVEKEMRGTSGSSV
uniref:Uncharacterized protein n=1 Tax=viral metagenome TaxID=1070528 RepID=A0A6H1Z8S7_9ZZZZ